MADHLHALQVGYRLDELEFQQVLSVGRYGIKYLAFDHDKNELCAVKEYLPDGIAARVPDSATVTSNTSAHAAPFAAGLARFLDEARVQSRIKHPNFVRVHRWIHANDTGYMVLEYVEGQTLSSLLGDGDKLAEQRLQQVIGPVLSPLEQLHDLGFRHHDIRPGNIVLRDDGQPMLLEIGASRQNLGTARQSFGDRSQGTQLSESTPGYAPVEKYSSGSTRLGAWTDIYALGAVMYRATVGEVPPDATSRVVQDDMTPAAQAAAGNCSKAILDAIDAALAIMPGERPASIAAWRAMLPSAWNEGALHKPRSENVARGSTRVAARGGMVPRRAQASEAKGQSKQASTRRWVIPTAAAVLLTALLTYVDVGVLRDQPPRLPPQAEASRTAGAAAAANELQNEPALDAADAFAPEEAEAPTPEEADAHASAQGETEAPVQSEPGAPAPVEAETPAPSDRATLIVATEPAGAEVLLNGEVVGISPLDLDDLFPGRYDIALRHPLYETQALYDQTLAADATLRIERALTRATGALAISTTPSGAWIERGGERLDQTTPATLEGLAAGAVTVAIGLDGYQQAVAEAEVPPDGLAELNVELEPVIAQGTLTLELEPAAAVVNLPGVDAPYAPGMSLPNGAYRVEVSLAGYVAQTRTVEVDGDVVAAFSLASATQPFEVLPTPPQAVVTLLDAEQDYAPGMSLPPGDYRVRVALEGYLDIEQTIRHGSAPTRQAIALQRLPPPAFSEVLARLTSANPAWTSDLQFAGNCSARADRADSECYSIDLRLTRRAYVLLAYAIKAQRLVYSSCGPGAVRALVRGRYTFDVSLNAAERVRQLNIFILAAPNAAAANSLHQILREVPGSCGNAGSMRDWMRRFEQLLQATPSTVAHRQISLTRGEGGLFSSE